jgi:hypothetical protein
MSLEGSQCAFLGEPTTKTMRHQPQRNSSSAAESTTGTWVIASSSVSNAATLAAGKAASCSTGDPGALG